MRAVKTALKILTEVREDPSLFASERIRYHSADLPEKELRLAAFMVYGALRRRELWEFILKKLVSSPFRKLELPVQEALILGISSVIGISGLPDEVIVNALVQSMKEKGFSRASRLVNAVLRQCTGKGRILYEKCLESGKIKDLCLVHGFPTSMIKVLSEGKNSRDIRDLLKFQGDKPFLSLRLSEPSLCSEVMANLEGRGFPCSSSHIEPLSIRLDRTAWPPSLPGFMSGKITPQSESSMMVARVVSSLFCSGSIVDMCAGRCIKTGQILQMIPDVELEAWDMSSNRLESGKRDLERLNLREDRVIFRSGNSLAMDPVSPPGLVLLDVPCSGSGTWRRHPEAKWRLTGSFLEELSAVQTKLLQKACTMVARGGFVVYSTCSLFRQENEGVLEGVLKGSSSLQEISVPLDSPYLRKGVPYGIYTWPELPWLDGFYIGVIQKGKGVTKEELL